MKKLLIVMLALAMVFALAACGEGGGSSSADPNLGVYTATSIDMYGVTTDFSELGEGDMTLELKAGGKGVADFAGSKGSFDWTLNGDELSIKIEGTEPVGTLKDGVIVIDLLGMDMDITFVKDGASAAAPATAPAAASELDWWDGEWYGWWIIGSDSTGYYEEMVGSAWDICAAIDTKSDGTATITLWDEDTSRSDPLGEVQLQISGEGKGTATAVGGRFYTDKMQDYPWYIDPATGDYENNMDIVGSCVDFEGDVLNYYILLRPWGQDWSDIAAEEEGLLPEYYASWYQPLIAAGKSAPDTIEVTK